MPFAFNDNLLALGKNGAAPSGALEASIARATRAAQHAGRPLATFPGALTTGSTVFRILRPNFLEGGGRRLRATVHVTGSGSAPGATPGVIVSGYQTNHDPGFSSEYPSHITALTRLQNDAADETAVSGQTEEVIVGTDSIYLRGASIYEETSPDYNVADTIDASKFAPNRDVLATQAGSYGTMNQLRDRFQHVWKMRRPVYNWAASEPNYTEFSTSSQQWRYIFDQSIGDGGTAPSATGPAITFPCYAAGIGRQTTVRVYVFAYAAMSGATDHGTLGVANKDANGTMQAFQALTHPSTIAGTSYGWYPALGAFDPAAYPYFLMPTGVAFDRICIGAKSNGATDKVRIKTLAMFVYPSML